MMTQAPGRPLPRSTPTPRADEVLAAAWAVLAQLHAAGLSHQGLAPDGLRLLDDGTVAFTDLATADAAPERRLPRSPTGRPARRAGRRHR